MPYQILDFFWVDEDAHVKAILTSQSSMWYLQYNVPKLGQRRKSLKTRSKKEARIRASRYLSKIIAGHGRTDASTPPRGSSLAEVVTLHLERLRAKKRAMSTMVQIELTYNELLEWAGKHNIKEVSELNAASLESFENAVRKGARRPSPIRREHAEALEDGRDPRTRRMEDGNAQISGHASETSLAISPKPASDDAFTRPRAAGTVRLMMKKVRALIRFALERELIVKDPSRGYQLPASPNGEAAVFTEGELGQIFADPDPTMAEIWRFLTHTCLRCGELIWLKCDDVIMDKNQKPSALRIRPKTCPESGVRWQPKHGRIRTVPLSDHASEIVARRLASSDACCWLFASVDRDETPRRWRHKRLRACLERRLREVGINHGTLHTFRHTGATLLANDVNAPMPLPALQRFLGHASITTTQIYLHANDDHVAAAVRRVGWDRTLCGVPQSASTPRRAARS